MPSEQLEQLHSVARRFHLLSSRVDYAKALALNGRLPEAESEISMIRGVYHPAVFAPIRREWDMWRDANHIGPPPNGVQ
jgi:hypothetical protein